MIAPLVASSLIPRRRKAQQSYATETKKLAGSRLSAPILQPMSDVVPLKPIGTDRELVRLLHHRRFDLRQPGIGIGVVERPEQLFLRVQITRRAIAANADADRARTAALPLCLPDRVEDALANAFERAIGAAEMIELGRQRVLRVRVLAAAALQDQLDFDVGDSPTDRNE